MTAKIFKSIFLTSIAVLILSLSIAFGVSYARYGSELESELKRECEYVAACYVSYGDYLAGSAEELRITHIDKNGRIVFDSTASDNSAEIENHLEREEVRQAFETGEGSSVRYSSTLEKTTL